MKTKLMIILTTLLLLALTGCNNSQKAELPFSSSESIAGLLEGATLFAERETGTDDTEPEVQTGTEDTETTEQTTSGNPSDETSADSQTTVAQNTENAPTANQQTTAQTETPPAGTSEKETPQPVTPPSGTEPTTESAAPPETTPQETPPQPKSIYDYEFDIAAIRLEMIAVGEAMGLTHITSDEGVEMTPDTASWAIPVTASRDFQGEALKRKLREYVQSMPELITTYGGNPIQYFSIYTEPLGDGSYWIYFLY